MLTDVPNNLRTSILYKRFGKRIFDFCVALALLVFLSPLIVSVSFLVFVFLGRPVIFRQKRPGLKGKIFVMFKFRTMREAYDQKGKPLSDEQRLTGFGKFLRKYSLDELPELVNVIQGDMSLVGPRPLLPEYLSLYSIDQRRRHDVLPGLTGLAQVNGRNLLSWEDKFKYDLTYVDNLSFLLDIKILFQTLVLIRQGRGISSPGCVTARRFGERSSLTDSKEPQKGQDSNKTAV